MILDIEDFVIKVWDSRVSVHEMLVDSGIVVLAVHLPILIIYFINQPKASAYQDISFDSQFIKGKCM